MRTFFRTVLVVNILFIAYSAAAAEYRLPDNPDVVSLLTANRTPELLFNHQSGSVSLVYRETLVPIKRLMRPHLGIAGYWFDPELRSSGYDSRIKRVEVLDALSGKTLAIWEPEGEPVLDDIAMSSDGRFLSAVSFSDDQPRIALFEIASGHERLLPIAVNPAYGPPCKWLGSDGLLCRLIPDPPAEAPAPFASPKIMDHPGGKAPTRTYSNLIDDAWEEEAFEHYFNATLARVDIDGKVQRFEDSTGLLARVIPSPDHKYALVARLQRPYSHLLKASHFPRRFELWDLQAGKPIEAPELLQQSGITPTKGISMPAFAWQPLTGALGWTEPREAGGERWLALDPPYTGSPQTIVSSEKFISRFGWTTQGTPYFSRYSNHGRETNIFIVTQDGTPKQVWKGAVKNLYDVPGRAIRTNGNSGDILEYMRHIFLASDGLGPDGPQPYIDSLNLDTLKTSRIATADEGDYERVVGIVDLETRTLLTIIESETTPPQLFSVNDSKRTLLGGLENPLPQLNGVERQNVRYLRDDGVELFGTLYLPPDHNPKKPLPTLVWIYPEEFSDVEYAEQMDSRRFRFHHIRGASPIAAVLNGYAVLVNPTVPIIGEGEDANDTYLKQLASSMEAAVNFLVKSGISDRDRIAISGQSYGAFSTVNLLAHTDLFRTGIAISGAYNRTLTPFGFQHEKRSLWEATKFYTSISPFYFVDKINEPLLLIHGGVDNNPGTPPMQAERLFHAMVGNGTRVRYVELPYEQHHYRARENVLHASAEMLDWLDHTIGHKAENSTP